MEQVKNPFKYRLSTRIMKAYRSVTVTLPFFNHFIRLLLKIHYLTYRSKVNRYCRKKKEQKDRWFNDVTIFFGFAIIRSGTTFLADLLTREVYHAFITHEAIVDDYYAYPWALTSNSDARRYIDEFRLNDIYYRAGRSDAKTYGEINPFLRRHCHFLQKKLPNARFFHIVRDGRDVVCSIMNRATFDVKDPLNGLILPPPSSLHSSKWPHYSRFEKVCWWWQAENQYLRTNIRYTLQFERLISDYSYFKEGLLDYLDMEIPEINWQQYVIRPKNVTQKASFPHWLDWSSHQHSVFKDMCGNEMVANGYTI